MKRHVRVQFNFRSDLGDNWQQAKKLLRSIGRKDLAAAGAAMFGYFLDYVEGDRALEVLRTALTGLVQSHNFVSYEWHRNEYSHKELLGAPLLLLTTRGSPVEVPTEKGGIASFDFRDACSRCGTGASRISSIVMSRKKFLKKPCLRATSSNEIIVHSDIVSSLKAASVTGIRYLRMKSARTGGELDWWHLIANHHLPPMSDETKGIFREEKREYQFGRVRLPLSGACTQCGVSGYCFDNSEPPSVVYDDPSIDLSSLPDVVTTYEYFGHSLLTTNPDTQEFASRYLLMKPKVYQVLKSWKSRKVEYHPVKIIYGSQPPTS